MDTAFSTPPASRSAGRTAWLWRWSLLLPLLASTWLNLLGMSNWRAAMDPAMVGAPGYQVSASGQRGWWRIDRVEPNSPVEQAGVRAGDLVRFDRISDINGQRAMRVDESIDLTWRSAAGERHLVVKPMPRPGFSATAAMVDWVTGRLIWLITLVGGLLLALRASDRPAMRALALGLIVVNSWGDFFVPGGAVQELLVRWVDPVLMLGLWLSFPYFALRFGDADRSLWPRRGVRWSYGALALLSGIYFVDDVALLHGLSGESVVDAVLGPLASGLMGPTIVGGVLSMAALVWSWRRSVGLERERVGWVALAVGLFLATRLTFALLSGAVGLELPHRWAWQGALMCVSLAMLAYAVLRHRVFDIGFVLNRVIVFSIASGIVVVARVVLDWAARRWLHSAEAGAGVLVDAAITLLLVLLFLPLQQAVGERVTRIFFRQWEEAAERLRAFVERAPHVTDAAELRRKLLAAVDDFGGSGGSAFYRRDGAAYQRVESTLAAAPERIAEDDDALVELRRTQGLVVLDELGVATQTACAALAVPMSVRGRIHAFVLVGHKPHRELYRPDELALLSRSVRSVGLDLEALRVEELERDNALAREESRRLGDVVGRLQGQPKPPGDAG